MRKPSELLDLIYNYRSAMLILVESICKSDAAYIDNSRYILGGKYNTSSLCSLKTQAPLDTLSAIISVISKHMNLDR